VSVSNEDYIRNEFVRIKLDINVFIIILVSLFRTVSYVNLLDVSLLNREMTLDEYEPTVMKDKTNINNDKTTYWH
jgi:hypothetical protein